MQHQHRHIDDLEILVKLGFREGLNAVVLAFDSAHHSLTPPVVSDTLRDLGTGTVVTIERQGEILVELRTMVGRTVTKSVEYFHRNAVRVLLRFQHARSNGADEYSFGDSPFSMLCDVADHLAAARRMTNVNRVFEIKRGDEFGNIGGIGVDVIAVNRLSGTAMPTAVMSDHSVTAFQKEHHLGIPVVSG